MGNVRYKLIDAAGNTLAAHIAMNVYVPVRVEVENKVHAPIVAAVGTGINNAIYDAVGADKYFNPSECGAAHTIVETMI